MKKLIAITLLASLATLCFAQDDGWISLFNGKDLDGWEIKTKAASEHWKVKDGVIDCSPSTHPKGDKHLWNTKSFKDFKLHIEWRIKSKKGIYEVPVVLPDGSYKKDANGKKITNPQPGADSGIYLRGSSKAQVNIWCWPIGSGEFYGYRNKQDDPKTRAAVTPKVNADNAVGEWNTFEITLVGDIVTVILNGKTVIEKAQLLGIPAEGPIALQHHGGYIPEKKRWGGASSLVQFRNIKIKPIE
ncbi:MAG: DUF1080 domain-containing protein [Kiritimatiellae bacterium]|jgi:hypothetical protein|nr:DUF1080 domain-containing protein [Kiritimatiellia bacterium]